MNRSAFRVLGTIFRETLKGIVARLAKLSIKEGCKELPVASTAT